MEQLTGTLGILLIFGAIIAIHEFGHFIVAKLSGMGVYEYSLGFGPALFKKEYHGTLYALRIIPLGGYVRIAGMEPGEDDAPDGYDKKPFFAKFATIAAGAVMNFVLAFLLIIILGMAVGYMKHGNKVVVGGVVPKSPASYAGLRAGDEVVEVQGMSRPTIDQARARIVKSTRPVKVVVLRDGKTLTFHPKPKRMLLPERDGFLYSMRPQSIIGVQFANTSGQWETLGFVASFKEGYTTVGGTLVDATAQLASVLSGRIPLNQLSGPVGIMKVSYDATSSDHLTRIWVAGTFRLLALLSMLIGFFNLLPIPALDGGRLLFLVIEGIRGKAMDKEKEAKIHAIGMAVLLGLVFLITIKDVFSLFRR